MARRSVTPKGPDISGSRVSFRLLPEDDPDFGTVLRMATGKVPCCFVKFDGSVQPKLCYVHTLEVLQ